MKKFMMIAAIAAVALTSCVKNDDVTLVEEQEIGFNAVAHKASKAIVTGATLADSDKFNVWGFYSDDNFATQSAFMTDVEISKVGTTWKNADRSYYWPLSGEINFCAIYPETLTPSSVTHADGATFTAYTISDANKVTDFMYAENKGSRQSAALPMQFSHALSQIVFNVKTNADYSADVTFNISSVTLNNIALTGAFVQKPTAAWTPAAHTSTFPYFATSAAATSTSAVYGAAILMIPQTMDAASAIEIAYSMTQDGKTINGTVTKTIAENWEMGKKYNYTLNFKLDEITFDPAVTSWVDVTVAAIDIN